MPTQNAGIHRLPIGDITVTALSDGVFQGATEMLAGVDAAEAETMLRATYRVVPPMLSVNAYLIQNGNHLALVDTGSGQLMGPSLGNILTQLSILGIAPSAINTVLMTHLHADHFGALVDGEGQATFANAELVVSEVESKFWNDPAVEAAAPERLKASLLNARRMTAPYASRTRLAAKGEVLPGIQLHPLPGHTPGHSGFLIESGRDSMLIWGDVVHIPGLQFTRPDIGMSFDVDVEQAATTRKQVMDMVATDGVRIGGMHLDFPTFAHIIRQGGGYAVVPEVWMP